MLRSILPSPLNHYHLYYSLHDQLKAVKPSQVKKKQPTLTERLLRNPHLRSPQYPILDRIPNLLTVNNSARLLPWNRRLIHRFMSIWIEHVPGGVEWLDVVFEECL
jgi:hypothetical protein